MSQKAESLSPFVASLAALQESRTLRARALEAIASSSPIPDEYDVQEWACWMRDLANAVIQGQAEIVHLLIEDRHERMMANVPF